MALYVKLDKKFYKTGSMVAGEVILNLKEQINIVTLKLFFTKTKKIIICDNHKGIEDVNDVNKVYIKEYSFDLDEEMTLGQYSFPFKFLLNFEDYASTKLCGYFNDMATEIENRYELHAEIQRDTKQIISSPSTVVNVFQEIKVERVSNVLLSVQNLLFTYKKRLINIFLDKTYYMPGEMLKINITNMKVNKAEDVKFKLYEVFIYKRSILRNRVLYECKGKTNTTVKNIFADMRIPNTCSATCKENDFEIEINIEVETEYHKNPIKFKKQINVIRNDDLVPTIEEYYPLDETKYNEVLINF